MSESPQSRDHELASADSVGGVSLFLRLWAYGGPLQPLSALTLDQEPDINELIRGILGDAGALISEQPQPAFFSAGFKNLLDAASAAKAVQQRFLPYRRKTEPNQVVPSILLCSTQDAEMSGLDSAGGAAALADILANRSSGQILIPASLFPSARNAPGLQINPIPVREAGPSGAPEALYELLWTDDSTYGHLRRAIQSRVTLGRYQIQEELGRGAMGAVYKAFDQVIGRTVALKAISIDERTPDHDDQMERLRREAQAAGKLDHPNIITVYDVGQDADVVYLSMQFLEGKTLFAYLADAGVPSLPTLISWADQITSAVSFAHTHGVIHRDLKPANLMLTNQGIIKVLDFGIAKIENATLTQTGLVVGTPSYMSPEQVAGKKVDHRTDLFSLGSVFYELVTHEKPFRGDVATILYKIVNEDPPAPSIINPALPGGIDNIIRKALAKDPNERFQSCEEMRKAFLEQAALLNLALAPSLPMNTAVAKPAAPSPEPFPAYLLEEVSPRRSRRIWPALGAGFLVALLGGMTWAFYVRSHSGSFPPAVGKLVSVAHRTFSRLSVAGSSAEESGGSASDQNTPGTPADSVDHATANTEASSLSSRASGTELARERESRDLASGAAPETPAQVQAASDGSHPSPTQNAQESTDPERAASAQSPAAIPPSDKNQSAADTTTDPNTAPSNSTAAKPAVASSSEQAPAITPASESKPHPAPRREARLTVDGFTRRDVPELLREADAAAGRGDYRLAIYSYNLILKLDPGNSAAKAGMRRVKADQQSPN